MKTLWMEFRKDILFLRGDLKRTRYVEVVDPNIPESIENAGRVKEFIGIFNLWRSEAQWIDSLCVKTKDDIRKLWPHLQLQNLKWEVEEPFCHLFQYSNTFLGMGTSKDIKTIQRELNTLPTIQKRTDRYVMKNILPSSTSPKSGYKQIDIKSTDISCKRYNEWTERT